MNRVADNLLWLTYGDTCGNFPLINTTLGFDQGFQNGNQKSRTPGVLGRCLTEKVAADLQFQHVCREDEICSWF
jgi:hypothetical protein